MKVNNETILTGEQPELIQLVNKNDLVCLSLLQLEGIDGIY